MDGLIEGRVVHYILSKLDAEEINRKRSEKRAVQNIRLSYSLGEDQSSVQLPAWHIPHGEQIHTGNSAMTGEHCPAIVVRVWPHEFGEEPGVNLQVFLDGNDSLWVTSVRFADTNEPGTCHWPERA